MARYIDVDKFIEDQREFYCEDCYMRKSTSTGEIVYDIDSAACGSCRLNDALNALDDTPTADVEKVRHGEWEDVACYDAEEIGVTEIASMRCNKCERFHSTVYRYGNPIEMMNYCPFCGAKMDGENDERRRETEKEARSNV